MKKCIFCKIIKKQAPAHILFENKNVIVFLSLNNHPLILPKKHITDIFSLDTKTGAEIMNISIKIAKIIKQKLKCDGIYITQANGTAGGQDVFHYHMHIYPKWKNGKKPNYRKQQVISKLKL